MIKVEKLVFQYPTSNAPTLKKLVLDLNFQTVHKTNLKRKYGKEAVIVELANSESKEFPLKKLGENNAAVGLYRRTNTNLVSVTIRMRIFVWRNVK